MSRNSRMLGEAQTSERSEPSSRARYRTVSTSHGVIAVEERGEHGVPVLFIHGNSSCSGVFGAYLNGPLAARMRFIAIDLPGHGHSADALDPARSYTIPGFAEAVCEVLAALDVPEVVVVGWSLGGHVGVEMLAASRRVRGLMLIGAPPVGRNQWSQGFVESRHFELASKQDWTLNDAHAFVSTIYGQMPQHSLRYAALRADGRMRARLCEAARAGIGADQRLIVETSRVPIAIVNGAADPLVNLDYFDTLAYPNLWDSRCHRLPGLGHAPFWQAPDVFASLLQRFVAEISSSARRAAADD